MYEPSSQGHVCVMYTHGLVSFNIRSFRNPQFRQVQPRHHHPLVTALSQLTHSVEKTLSGC